MKTSAIATWYGPSRLVAGSQTMIGREPYRTDHADPYFDASCQLLGQC